MALRRQTYCIAGVNCDCERGHNFGICIPLDLQFMRIYHFVKYTGDSKWYIFRIKLKVTENLLCALYSSDQRGENYYRFVVDKLQKRFNRV